MCRRRRSGDCEGAAVPLGDTLGRAAQYTHLGLTFAASVALMFFVGYWADGKLHTRPLLAIVGAFLGATGGFINLVRTLNRLQREDESGRGGDDLG